jgi:hypothetical protein
MAHKAKRSRIADTGRAKLLGEQEALLGELMRELDKRDSPVKPNRQPVENVVRNLESRMEEVKWPARNQDKIRELEAMAREQDPAAYRRWQDEQRNPNDSYGGYRQGNMGNSRGGFQDSVDQLQESVGRGDNLYKSGQYDTQRPVQRGYRQETIDSESSYDESRERRKRKKKLREKMKMQLHITKQQEALDRPVPDPSVLAYVFNPFRLMPWNIPSVDKYKNELEELEKKRKDKQKEAQIALAEADILERRNKQQQDAAEAKKMAFLKEKKKKGTVYARNNSRSQTRKISVVNRKDRNSRKVE